MIAFLQVLYAVLIFLYPLLDSHVLLDENISYRTDLHSIYNPWERRTSFYTCHTALLLITEIKISLLFISVDVSHLR
jgi:hypothetical protein